MFKDQGFVILVVILSGLWYYWSNLAKDTLEEQNQVKAIVDDWKAQGAFFEFEGNKIFYIDKLNKEQTLLILHGFPTCSWDFSHIVPNISVRYRAVLLDMLGFGLSDKPKNHKYSIMEQADIALALMQKLEITDFHILAHDYGVSVAQEIIARKQNTEKESEKFNILSVAFLNGGLFPAVHRALFTQKLLANPVVGPYVHYVMGRSAFTSTMTKIFGKTHPPTKEEVMVFWEFININNGLPNFHALLGYMHDRRNNEIRWRTAVTKPPVPIRIINGPSDPISGVHVVEYYNNINEDPQLGGADVLAAGVGHYPQVEAPEQVMHFLNVFWDNVSEYYTNK
eukprot:Phypoly_transcript_10197.p1 GENE.Phypoly_transcript_10197~~Phypoly_transcript_10197.p1  ORF type:complete len:339 (+),score=42.09 Phypoly_transcript_10197:15-1031(+)